VVCGVWCVVCVCVCLRNDTVCVSMCVRVCVVVGISGGESRAGLSYGGGARCLCTEHERGPGMPKTSVDAEKTKRI